MPLRRLHQAPVKQDRTECARRLQADLTLGKRPPAPTAFVVHAFTDGAVVRPACEAHERGEIATEPPVGAAQERLRACSHGIARFDRDGLVCATGVQHAVLDPPDSARLRRLLSLGDRR